MVELIKEPTDLAPVSLMPSVVANHAAVFAELWNGLEWERRGSTPRREYYVNPNGRAYTYGKGAGQRTYEPKVMTSAIEALWKLSEQSCGCSFDVCFLNGYEDGSDQLGWHADDSPEMDPARPIAIVSLGAAREIWFKPIGEKGSSRQAIVLPSGSVCAMPPGLQSTHWHRIPKSSAPCGPRISLTFRGWTPGA